jgi:hypothetical protein
MLPRSNATEVAEEIRRLCENTLTALADTDIAEVVQHTAQTTNNTGGENGWTG